MDELGLGIRKLLPWVDVLSSCTQQFLSKFPSYRKYVHLFQSTFVSPAWGQKHNVSVAKIYTVQNNFLIKIVDKASLSMIDEIEHYSYQTKIIHLNTSYYGLCCLYISTFVCLHFLQRWLIFTLKSK